MRTSPRVLAAVLATWVAAVVVVLAVAAGTKVGPVLVQVSGRHGVHLGDVLAALACVAAAVATTAGALLNQR